MISNTDKIQDILLYQKKYQYSSLSRQVKNAFRTDLLMRLAWNTNHLEGNTLSLDETVDVIEYDEVHSGHTYSEYREAKNAYRALDTMLDFTQAVSVDEDWIRRANSIIMDSDGQYRARRVYIGTLAEEAFVPPAPEMIPALMRQYSERLGKADYTKDIEDVIRNLAVLHIDFERIHPFVDGNGRTGRLFLSQMLLNAGLMPAIFENNSRYRQAFRLYDRSKDTSIMEYCIESGILRSYDVLRQNCEKLLPGEE